MPREHRLCHVLIKETAIAMAHEIYSELMKDNKRYKDWKSQCEDLTPVLAEDLFVKNMWPKLLEQARATLAGLLETTLDENLKTQIVDALIKDNSLMKHGERLKVIGTASPSDMIH